MSSSPGNLDDMVESSAEPIDNKLSEFLELLKRGKKANDEDCDEPDEECEEIKSECCGSKLKTIFGSLPLKVKCEKCSEEYVFGELISNL